MTEISEFFELQYAHICNYASMDNNGNANLIGIFSQINAISYPTTLGRFVVAVSLKSRFNTDKDFVFSVAIKSPDGKVQKPLVTNLKNAGENNVMTVFAEINNYVFQAPGKYEISIFMDDEMIKTIPLNALVAKKAV
jgi:hypothetical protein